MNVSDSTTLYKKDTVLFRKTTWLMDASGRKWAKIIAQSLC
jgi:hypothetical protein